MERSCLGDSCLVKCDGETVKQTRQIKQKEAERRGGGGR